MIYVHEPTARFLVTLGWEIEHVGSDGACAVKPFNKTFADLCVERVRRGLNRYSLQVFVLTAACDGYVEQIGRKIVDTTKPRWQDSVNAWFQRATFALADLKRVEEEKETLARIEERKNEQAINDLTGGAADPKEILRLMAVNFTTDAAGVRVVSGANRRSYLYDPFVLPRGLSKEQSLAKVARLVNFLKSEGMLPGQYPDRNFA